MDARPADDYAYGSGETKLHAYAGPELADHRLVHVRDTNRVHVIGLDENDVFELADARDVRLAVDDPRTFLFRPGPHLLIVGVVDQRGDMVELDGQPVWASFRTNFTAGEYDLVAVSENFGTRGKWKIGLLEKSSGRVFAPIAGHGVSFPDDDLNRDPQAPLRRST
ncbi:MAG: hypothetical protein AAF743_07465 [Planctomycetota bacterium]